MQHYEYVVEDSDGLAISVFDSRAEVVEFLRDATVSFADLWHVKDLWQRLVVSGTFERIEHWAAEYYAAEEHEPKFGPGVRP